MLDKLRSQIEKTNYWDARVVKLECNYFCDEFHIKKIPSTTSLQNKE